MNLVKIAVAALCGSMWCAAALADTAANGAPASNVKNYHKSLYESLSMDKKSLFDQLGGKGTIERIVSDGVDNLLADRRIAHHFAKTSIPILKVQLSEQICQLSGGPCKYQGRSMEAAHKGLNLKDSDFIALVEDFRDAIKKNGVAFEQENKLLALLAPMKPAIVYK